MFQCIIEAVGAGGGSGGSASTNSSQVATSGGGGGGEYGFNLLTSSQIGSSQTVTIGAGGAAGSNSPGSGGTGGNTSVGSLLVCIGGGGSVGGISSGPGGYQSGGGSGGIGGTASAGQYYFTTGGHGYFGFSIITGSPINGGASGSSFFCPQGAYNSTNTTNPGGVYTEGYGGGSAGSCNAASQSATTGSAGQNGFVKITEYIIN
jgi:hypothetical protein